MAASCFAAGNPAEANKHKDKAQKMAKYVELLQKVARRRNLQVIWLEVVTSVAGRALGAAAAGVECLIRSMRPLLPTKCASSARADGRCLIRIRDDRPHLATAASSVHAYAQATSGTIVRVHAPRPRPITQNSACCHRVCMRRPADAPPLTFPAFTIDGSSTSSRWRLPQAVADCLRSRIRQPRACRAQQAGLLSQLGFF